MSPIDRKIEELSKGSYEQLKPLVNTIFDEFEGEDKKKLATFFKEQFIKNDNWDVKPKKKQFLKVQKIKEILNEK